MHLIPSSCKQLILHISFHNSKVINIYSLLLFKLFSNSVEFVNFVCVIVLSIFGFISVLIFFSISVFNLLKLLPSAIPLLNFS